jgi:hypothetical protein
VCREHAAGRARAPRLARVARESYAEAPADVRVCLGRPPCSLGRLPQEGARREIPRERRSRAPAAEGLAADRFAGRLSQGDVLRSEEFACMGIPGFVISFYPKGHAAAQPAQVCIGLPSKLELNAVARIDAEPRNTARAHTHKYTHSIPHTQSRTRTQASVFVHGPQGVLVEGALAVDDASRAFDSPEPLVDLFGFSGARAM